MNLLPKPKKNHRKGWTTSVMPQHVYRYIERNIRQWDICGKKTAGSNTAGNRAFASAFRRRNKGWRFLS